MKHAPLQGEEFLCDELKKGNTINNQLVGCFNRDICPLYNRKEPAGMDSLLIKQVMVGKMRCSVSQRKLRQNKSICKDMQPKGRNN